jgi:hypothetical protein
VSSTSCFSLARKILCPAFRRHTAADPGARILTLFLAAILTLFPVACSVALPGRAWHSE